MLSAAITESGTGRIEVFASATRGGSRKQNGIELGRMSFRRFSQKFQWDKSSSTRISTKKMISYQVFQTEIEMGTQLKYTSNSIFFYTKPVPATSHRPLPAEQSEGYIWPKRNRHRCMHDDASISGFQPRWYINATTKPMN